MFTKGTIFSAIGDFFKNLFTVKGLLKLGYRHHRDCDYHSDYHSSTAEETKHGYTLVLRVAAVG